MASESSATPEKRLEIEGINTPPKLVTGIGIGGLGDFIILQMLYGGPQQTKASLIGAYLLPLEVAQNIAAGLTEAVKVGLERRKQGATQSKPRNSTSNILVSERYSSSHRSFD